MRDQIRAEDEDLDNNDSKKDHDHTHRMSEAVVEPHFDTIVDVDAVPLRPWRPWTEALAVSPHAGGIMKRGFFQPIALLGLPMVWWMGLLYGIYQIWFNSASPGRLPLRGAMFGKADRA